MSSWWVPGLRAPPPVWPPGGGASTSWSSTRPRSPATRPAATGSRPRRCASSSSSASTCADCPATWRCARRSSSARTAARSRSRCRGDGDHAAVVPRVELDAAIVDTARALGRRGSRRRRRHGARDRRRRHHAPTTDGDGIGPGPLRRRRRRPLLRSCGAAARRRRRRELGTWHAFRQYFHGVDDRRLWVLFEADLLPGYAWVFPLPGRRANVGFGVLRRPGHDRQGAQRPLARAARPARACAPCSGPHAEPEATHRAWPIPASFEYDALADGRVLYVGDAANVVDPLTGEGIAQAIETALLAVDAIATRRGRRRRAPVHRGRAAHARARPALRRRAPAHAPLAPRGRAGGADCGLDARGRGVTSPAGCSRTIRARVAAHARPLASGDVRRRRRVPLATRPSPTPRRVSGCRS